MCVYKLLFWIYFQRPIPWLSGYNACLLYYLRSRVNVPITRFESVIDELESVGSRFSSNYCRFPWHKFHFILFYYCIVHFIEFYLIHPITEGNETSNDSHIYHRYFTNNFTSTVVQVGIKALRSLLKVTSTIS